MKTQKQHYYAAVSKTGETNEFINWLAKQDNAPTKAELARLREKRNVWNHYPESFCK